MSETAMTSSKTAELVHRIAGQPVIPVLKIENAADAVPLARALARGGLPLIEITLRTPAALEAIRRAAEEVEEAVVGAGTILSAAQFDEAATAGARFIVSPGLSPDVLAAAAASAVPLLPGAITPGEIMNALEAGLDFLQILPGRAGRRHGVPEIVGSRRLPACASVRPAASLPPTPRDYLALANVICVGGSWVAPDPLVKAGRWDEIEALARAAAALAKR